MQPVAPDKRRIETIDLARGLALLAMAIYHLAWDLEFFGYAWPGMTAVGGWKLFARAIASSFLFLVGVSLVLAHGATFRPRPFFKRFAQVAAAALLISLVTYLAVPGGFIFFGILHEIAVASLIGVLFLRLPPLLTLLVAALVVAAPQFLRSTFFDTPILWWVGLSSVNPNSNDYVPIFPWLGAVLAGIAAGRAAMDAGFFARLAPVTYGAWARPLLFAGRHSLATYLIHQPVLIACVWLFSQLYPPPAPAAETGFLRVCRAQCETSRSGDFCRRYCGCALERVTADGRLAAVLSPTPDEEDRLYMQEVASICSAETEAEEFEEMGEGR